MTLGGVKAGDLVLIDKKGREFLAVVREKADGVLKVTPTDRIITYHDATAREVVGHWSKRGKSRVPAVAYALAAAA